MKKALAIMIALTMLALPMIGFALELTALPDSYQELLEMLPANQCPVPDDIEFFFNFEHPLIRVRCLEADWPMAGGRIGGVWAPPAGPGFVYDPAAGEYVSSPGINTYMMVGDMNGAISLESRPDENGWTRIFILYFDQIAFENINWPEFAAEPIKIVGVQEESNYLMPIVYDQMGLDNGILRIEQYADRTEAVLFDDKDKELERKVYPEVLEFCSQYVLNRGE